MFQIAIHRDQHAESCLGGPAQKLTILHASPANLDYCLNLVAPQLGGELTRHGLIEENAHPLAGLREPTPGLRRLLTTDGRKGIQEFGEAVTGGEIVNKALGRYPSTDKDGCAA